MGAGTLYGTLKRMLESGLIKEGEPQVDHELGDERRIYYQLTESGIQSLTVEIERYVNIAELVQQLKLWPKNVYAA